MTQPKNHLNEIENMAELSQARLWKSLDSISERLGSIESQLTEVVRLEERVENHGKSLNAVNKKLDDHDARLQGSELWQARQLGNVSIQKMISNVESNVSDIELQVRDLKTNKNISKGHKDIGKEILKWIVAFLTVLIIYVIRGK